MTLSFNSTLPPKHLYKGEDFEHKYVSGDISIYIKADTKNNIFRTRYLCPEWQTEYFENMAVYIQDKNLDELIENLSQKILETANNTSEKFNQFLLQLSILHFREALYTYRGDLRSIVHLDSEKLICRCMGVDWNRLHELFLKVDGKKEDIFKESNISLICGNCSVLVKKTLGQLSQSEQIFEGKSFEVWKEEIEKHLEEFHFYSPKEFSSITDIKVSSIQLPALALELVCSGEAPASTIAKTSLENYLGQELNMPLDIKISFRSSSSTSQT